MNNASQTEVLGTAKGGFADMAIRPRVAVTANNSFQFALLYVVLAIATLSFNIAVQATVMWLYRGPYDVLLSMAVATGFGLPLKYVLEKKIIFRFKADNIAHDGVMFVLYSCSGAFTTALFWLVEYAFHLAFETDATRYLGAAIGLSAGFFIKYQIDKRLVFRRHAREAKRN